MGRETTEHPARKMLAAYSDKIRELELNMDRLSSIEESMTAPKASNLDGMPHGSGAFYDRISSLVSNKDKVEADIIKQAEDVARLRAEIEALISLVDKAEERAVLRLRYVDQQQWADVAHCMFGGKYSADDYDDERCMRRAFRVHGTALENLIKAYDETRGGSEA